VPVGPEVKVDRFTPTLLALTNVPELTDVVTAADPPDPAVFVLSGPATSPLIPDPPVPPFNEKIVPVLLPDKLVEPPEVAAWSRLELNARSLLPAGCAACATDISTPNPACPTVKVNVSPAVTVKTLSDM
jgi:hypothetical protein